MESNEKVTNRDLFRMAFRSCFLQASYNYERMQAGGWLYSLIPALRRVSKTRDELAERMLRHLDFFNTHPFISTTILGIIAAMEEKRQEVDSIRAIRTAMMGPFGGIGDALIWLTVLPISAGVGVSLAMEGNIAGPILFLLMFNIVHILVRFGGVYLGYKSGINAMETLTRRIDEITHMALIIGIMVAGALIASYVDFETTIQFSLGEVEINLQEELFDAIMPNLLPFLYTIILYLLIRRGYSPIRLIGITVLIGLVGGFFGIL